MSEFKLEIITPDKQYFDGSADAVTFTTDNGELTVLKGHQTMVASIIKGHIRIKNDGEWSDAIISEGFAEVRPDEVIIFSRYCDRPEDYKAAHEERKRIAAEERIRHEQDISEQKQDSISIARSLQVKSKTSKNI